MSPNRDREIFIPIGSSTLPSFIYVKGSDDGIHHMPKYVLCIKSYCVTETYTYNLCYEKTVCYNSNKKFMI
jgi:hypothetical protein